MSVNEVKLPKAAKAFAVLGGGAGGRPGSKTFCIGDEDHTLGNALRHVLVSRSDVSFAGYSVPHPSEPVVHLRVQTANDSVTAVDALQSACRTLIDQGDVVLDALEQLLPTVKEDRMRIEKALMEEDANDDEDPQHPPPAPAEAEYDAMEDEE
jgi:DNA-directed RNA polymerase I and III subunit RPAC2